MHRDKRDIHLRIDGYTRFCLTAIVVLLSVLIVGLWAEGVPGPARTGAATPAEPPSERYQPRSAIDISELLQVQERTNAKLEEIKTLFQKGEAKVQVVGGIPTNTGGDEHAQPTSTNSATGGIRSGVHAN